MKITGQTNAPETQQCTKCGYVGRTVFVIQTLAATHDDPAEYCWACPECMGMETLDSWEGEGDDEQELQC